MISKDPSQKSIKSSEQNCFVYIVLPGKTEFVTAARFQISKTRIGDSIGKLIYGKNYLSNPNAVELDPVELKLQADSYETVRMQGFFGAIRDAMPDFWGRQLIQKNLGLTPLDDFGYLMHGPDDRAGALGFGLNVTPPAPRKLFNRTLNLESLQILAELIIQGPSPEIQNLPPPINPIDFQQIQNLLLEGTSMGGARPKAVIEDKKILWIAKLSSPQDRWNQPLIEHALLKLAKKCGLTVAESKIIQVAQKDVLLVRRFDREFSQEALGYHRHRMVSALTLLKSDDSASSRENWSYLALADEIRRISAKPVDDLKELFQRMCFNALVSNLDDHPRNHAVLAKNSTWRLSPAYDLTPSPVIAQDKRFLAMTCGDAGRVAQEENLLSACGRFMLSSEEAKDLLISLVKTIQGEWESCLHRVGASQKDISVIQTAFLYAGFFNQDPQ